MSAVQSIPALAPSFGVSRVADHYELIVVGSEPGGASRSRRRRKRDIAARNSCWISPPAARKRRTNHPHHRARGSFVELSGVVQPAPAFEAAVSVPRALLAPVVIRRLGSSRENSILSMSTSPSLRNSRHARRTRVEDADAHAKGVGSPRHRPGRCITTGCGHGLRSDLERALQFAG